MRRDRPVAVLPFPPSSSMPLRTLHTAEGLLFQQSDRVNGVHVVYLPGVHGCWTPLDKAGGAIARHYDLTEIAYPLMDDWTLEHYADALLHLMDDLDIDSAHIIGESFGSLVGWQFGLNHPSRIRSHILVGGLVRAPALFRAATARIGLSTIPAPAFARIVDNYVSFKQISNPSMAAVGVKAYPAVRDDRGMRATANRMRLIQKCDFRSQLAVIDFPVRYIGGSRDWVVPVKREILSLREALPSRRTFQSHVIPGAPHSILASHPELTVKYIIQWLDEIERSRQATLHATASQ